MTTDPVEMRQQAVSLDSALFRKEEDHKESVDEPLQDLPQLGPEERAVLDSSLEELTAAVGQVAADGAPAGRAARRLLQALLEVFGSRPVGRVAGVFPDRPGAHNMSACSSATQTRGLDHCRPVVCTDCPLLSKELANRLKKFLETIIQRDQSYCGPDRSIMDHLFLMRGLLNVCVISLDQEKAF